MTLTKDQIEELDALASMNDALGKPSAIAHQHWEGCIRYCDLASAGLVRRYARPPKGFSASRFFGVKITDTGRAAINP